MSAELLHDLLATIMTGSLSHIYVLMSYVCGSYILGSFNFKTKEIISKNCSILKNKEFNFIVLFIRAAISYGFVIYM